VLKNDRFVNVFFCYENKMRLKKFFYEGADAINFAYGRSKYY